ncbi:MAG: hypothetical protein K2W95_05540 [Candidatus Obscuribacterales bacterium]|nr:hypothetical protein [Candidatus Obscuribacterales bacterium]
MHLDQMDLAPALLLLLTLIPLVFTRRRIRELEEEETRIVQASTGYTLGGPRPLPVQSDTVVPDSVVRSHSLVASDRRRLAEVRLDLAHYRMIRRRAWRMLIPCGLILAIMLFI